MSNDLQASISSRIQGVTGPMTQVESGTNRLTAATAKLNRETKDYQKNVTDSMRKAGVMTAESGRGIAGLAQAIAKLGGPVGEVAGRVGGGAGMAGGLGRLAAAAGVAAFALKALNAVSEANVQRTRLAIEAQEQWTKAIQDGQAAMVAQGKAGAGQAGGRRKAIGRGGAEADEWMNIMAEVYGMDAASAQQLVATAFQIKDPDRRGRAMTAAATDAATGEVDAVSAITEIVENRGTRRSLDAGGSTDAIAAQAIGRVTGKRFSERDLAASLSNVDRDPFLQASRKISNAGGRVAAGERAQTVDNQNVIIAEMLNTLNPLAQAILAQANANAKQLDAMDRLAAAQGGAAALKDNAGLMMGGEGSLENRRRRQANANGSGAGPSPVMAPGQPFRPGG